MVSGVARVSKLSKVEYYKTKMSSQQEESSQPVAISKRSRNNYQRQRSSIVKASGSWSTEIDHDREWERRKQVINAASASKNRKKVVGRCASDCTGMRSKQSEQQQQQQLVRTRSLTDVDLDELRGCIDLGFGFRNEADPELWKTLPALELCYAISQQLKIEVSQHKGHNPSASPVTPLALGAEFSSESGADDSVHSSPTSAAWQIASPGDHPQEVKTRLKHWARAVACTVRQSL